MKDLINKIIDAIAVPFVSIAVLIDESRRNNEDHSWDTYYTRRRYREDLRAAKAEYKRKKAEITNKWRAEK